MAGSFLLMVMYLRALWDAWNWAFAASNSSRNTDSEKLDPGDGVLILSTRSACLSSPDSLVLEAVVI